VPGDPPAAAVAPEPLSVINRLKGHRRHVDVVGVLAGVEHGREAGEAGERRHRARVDEDRSDDVD
jgi:hypothetical protein